jgi:hypothetical protein
MSVLPAGGGELGAARGRCHARWDGFDLDASHVVPAGARARLERLCRYVLRPAVVNERLHLCHDGQVLWRLPRPGGMARHALRFDPCEFLGRLAVLVPRPRVNLLFYHGVLGARSAWRRAIVPGRAADRGGGSAVTSERTLEGAPPPRPPQWADLMRRSSGFDVLACDRCGGRLRLIALISTARSFVHPDAPGPADRRAGDPARSLTAAESRLRRQLIVVPASPEGAMSVDVCAHRPEQGPRIDVHHQGDQLIRAVSRIRGGHV